ncbi:MAG: aminotransferase class V-fold PLP-dependent enzyme [Clostridia bacterium]|nr:aminotransferase class V-fold PLP-dependent enzyme [Clostridia bacterium]
MIYLDNAATSFPKPRSVYSAVTKTMKKHGGNPSRGAHKLARSAAEALYSCRQQAAELFGCDSTSVVLTYNATHALNLAIKGLCEEGSHILISDIEHNSVLRPVHALTKTHNCTYDIFPSCNGDADAVIKGIEEKLRPETRMIIACHVSNICGIRLPVEQIGELCQRRGIIFIVDASQSAGHIKIDLNALRADAICMAGHKGLYGPAGTGLLIFGKEHSPSTVIEGGSGADSAELLMPAYLPERLEAGTLSAPLAAGLAEGMRWLRKIGIDTVSSHERYLSRLFSDYLSDVKGIKLYGNDIVPKSGTVLFNLNGVSAARLGQLLDENAICVRTGLHCAPLAHRTLGTGEDGAVRVSFGYFNTVSDVRQLALVLQCLAGRIN